MRIALIAAMSDNGVIGLNNKLPWHLPGELQYFKKMTLGKPIIMGRKTFESMNSKPLPGRQNIILTEKPDFQALGCTVVHSVDQALKAAGPCEEVMVIGGAKVYALFLPLASRLYITEVEGNYEGDTYFPKIDWQAWTVVEENKYVLYTTKVLDRGKAS